MEETPETQPQCYIEKTVERIDESSTGKTTLKETEKRIFTGDAAKIIAREEAEGIKRISLAKSDRIKTIAKGAAWGIGIGLTCLITSSDTPSASAPSKAVSTDGEIPGDNDVSGNGGRAV